MIMDFRQLDTTPGGSSFCSPPVGWEGDESAYMDWLRLRYKTDPGFSQYMICAAWKGPLAQTPSTIVGPFSGAFRQALDRLA